jgi:hypothetical protein
MNACEELEAVLAQPVGTASKTDSAASKTDNATASGTNNSTTSGQLSVAERLAAALAAEEAAQSLAENERGKDSSES